MLSFYIIYTILNAISLVLLAPALRTHCLNQFVFLSLNFKLKDIDQMCCDRKLKD